MKKLIFFCILLLLLAGCNDSGNSPVSDSSADPGGGTGTPEPPAQYSTTDLKSKKQVNPAPYIPPQCYTITQEEGGTAYNTCYNCHTSSIAPNYVDDNDLQLSYSLPSSVLENPWTNMFEDRTAQVDAISDTDILEYIRTDNYMDEDGNIIISEKLSNLADDWDFNENGVWDGYSPDCRFDFDTQGFDREGDEYTGWRAFAYASFPSTFWPANGSIDDVLIRLAESFRQDSSGNFDLAVYKVNLAIVESLITRRDVLLESPVDESLYGVDLNRNGKTDTAEIIKYDWAPANGRNMNYVGLAETERAEGSLHLAAGLYPEGTEFLHTVRYVDVDDVSGKIKLSTRIKELRYAKKRSWQTYSDLLQAAQDEVKENHDFPDRTRQLIGDVENGINNDQGWLYQGFIEDTSGELRPQTYEETAYCVGCHGGVGTTVDGTFSFSRKFASDRSDRNGWYHWTQIDRYGTVEPMNAINNAGVQNEYGFYLMYNGAGDEYRSNMEIIDLFFDGTGNVDSGMLQELNDDVSILLYPSRERALEMNKIYKTIVDEQSYIKGREVALNASSNIHSSVEADLATGVEIATNKGAFINALGPVRTIHSDSRIMEGSTEMAILTGGPGSTPDSIHYQIDENGLIHQANYSLSGAEFGFSFPPRITLPARQLVPNGNMSSCYRCHRLPAPMPPDHPEADPPIVVPDSYGDEDYTLTRLTTDSAVDTMPVTSPDGLLVSWVSDRGGREQIWLMNPDGSNKHQLVVSGNLQGWQRFSPDSLYVAFWEYDPETSTHFLKYSDLSGNVVTLDSNSGAIERPVFTPDGSHLAYAKQIDGNWDVWIISVDGLTSYRLTDAADMESSPWFGPDGVMAYKVAPSGVYGLTLERFMTFESGYGNPTIYDWDGPHSVQLSDISSDGTMISFTAEAVSDTSGKNRVSYLAVVADLNLSGNTAVAENIRLISKSATLGDRGIMFSPDSSSAVFWSLNQDGRAGLWLYDVETDTSVQLTKNGFDYEPVWSSDGESLFFTSTRGSGQYDIWRLDL